MRKAMFGAGCFWGVEAAFRRVPGVRDTKVGFSGGGAQPDYGDGAAEQTGQTQVVLIDYDEEWLSYEELLEVFWRIHDPTQIDRPGASVDPQYRSMIFYFDDEQRRAAETSRQAQTNSSNYSGPIRTEIVPAEPLYQADDRHQRYYEKRGRMARSLFRE